MSKTGKIVIIVGGIIGILLLLRVGATIPASVLGFVLFLTALAEHAMRIYYFRKAARQQFGGDLPKKSGEMTLEEAREMLEIDASASTEEIRKAHRRLIAKVHPDQGGSKYLAAQLNAARDMLLKAIEEKKE